MTKVKTANYCNMRLILGRCYLFKSFFSNEDITDEISYVGLLQNHTKVTTSIFMSTQRVRIECIVYLKDKREIHIDTKDVKLIRYLTHYM